jgi:hypothetical protein
MDATHANNALRRIVGLVALLNLSYFGVEFAVALAIGPVSLFADSIDFLEDASINFLIFAALEWSAARRARVGMALDRGAWDSRHERGCGTGSLDGRTRGTRGGQSVATQESPQKHFPEAIECVLSHRAAGGVVGTGRADFKTVMSGRPLSADVLFRFQRA